MGTMNADGDGLPVLPDVLRHHHPTELEPWPFEVEDKASGQSLSAFILSICGSNLGPFVWIGHLPGVPLCSPIKGYTMFSSTKWAGPLKAGKIGMLWAGGDQWIEWIGIGAFYPLLFSAIGVTHDQC